MPLPSGQRCHYFAVAGCDFCGEAHVRWRYTAACDPPEWDACDTCHILVGNGWWLDLSSRYIGMENETTRRRFQDFVIDRNRQVLALEDASLATSGTWQGKQVPVGWRLDEAQERWLPPEDA